MKTIYLAGGCFVSVKFEKARRSIEKAEVE